jgi:hypothetical protein
MIRVRVQWRLRRGDTLVTLLYGDCHDDQVVLVKLAVRCDRTPGRRRLLGALFSSVPHPTVSFG